MTSAPVGVVDLLGPVSLCIAQLSVTSLRSKDVDSPLIAGPSTSMMKIVAVV